MKQFKLQNSLKFNHLYSMPIIFLQLKQLYNIYHNMGNMRYRVTTRRMEDFYTPKFYTVAKRHTKTKEPPKTNASLQHNEPKENSNTVPVSDNCYKRKKTTK
jgi:hypothetical protein